MSNFLAVDTSSRYLTVAAQKGDRSVLRHLPDCAMQHSVILMDEIDKALNEISLSPAECDFFAAVTGPGSFTGIRIGIAAVKGFALATGKRLLAITSFDLIAYNVTDENFYAVIDAGRGSYYVCGYASGADGKRTVALQPCYMDGESVAKLGAPLYGFEDLPLNNYTKTHVKNSLHPVVCANQARLTDEIYALYVRKSQAEENRNAT